MEKRRINVRKRIIVATIACTTVFAALTGPFIPWSRDFISKPADLNNVRIIKEESRVLLNWDLSQEFDIKNYIIIVNDQDTILSSSVDNFEINRADVGVDNFKIKVYAQDLFGSKSQGLEAKIDFNNNVSREERLLNASSIETSKNYQALGLSVYAQTLLVGSLVLGFTYWILLLGREIKRLKDVRLLSLLVYPAITTSPILLLSLSFIQSESENFSKLIIFIVSTIIFYVLVYLMYLTVNILNNSLYYELPLEQAAKASQFVFSLISSYIVLVVFLGTDLSIIYKIIMVTPFIFYFSFSSICLLKDVSTRVAFIRTLSITLAVTFSMLVLSMWPVSYVYLMLAVAVIYYILLSISLEAKTKLKNYVIVEYSLLVFLISIILIIFSNWGIMGNLL